MTIFILLERLDFHMVDNLSIAEYALPKRMLTSLSVNEILLTRYMICSIKKNKRKRKKNDSSFKHNAGKQSSISISIYIRGSLNKFPDFFRMGTFIDSTHMKL